MCKSEAEAQMQETKPDETSAIASGISQKKPAASYWMQRLSKERRDRAARVISGEISCYRGCIEAGIRKQPAKKWTKPEDFGIKAKADA